MHPPPRYRGDGRGGARRRRAAGGEGAGIARGYLIDIGGTLAGGGRPVAGAAAALARLGRFRLLTNTTSRSRSVLAAELAAMGLPVAEDGLLTPAAATADHLRRVGGGSLFLVAPGARADLAGLPEGEDHVVVGDTDAAFGRAAMTRALRALRAGADLIAMARDRWFMGPDGPEVDIGAVVAALEYAAGVRAAVTGKPSAAFFLAGVRALGLRPGEVVMVGDDPEADIVGAARAGLRTVWVGRAAAWPDSLPVRPGRIIPSIAAL